MTQTIGHWGFPAPEASEPPDGPSQIAALGTFLNGNVNGRVPMANQGVLSARPVSTVGVPGKRDRRFLVVGDPTPANNGREFIDTGTSWVEVFGSIPDGSISTAKIADGAVTSVKLGSNLDGAKLLDASVAGGKLANSTVTATQVAATLKPSSGAANATEALRALGTSAGMALPGNQAAGGDLGGTYPNPRVSLPIVSTLPAGAGLFDGMRVAYQNAAMAAAGVVWEFRYRVGAPDPYKWEFVGGGWLMEFDDAQYSTITTTFLSVGSKILTVPLPGDYVFTMRSEAGMTSTTSTDFAVHGLALTTGAVVNADLQYAWAAPPAPIFVALYGSTGIVPVFDRNAGDSVRPKHKSSSAGNTVLTRSTKFGMLPRRVT